LDDDDSDDWWRGELSEASASSTTSSEVCDRLSHSRAPPLLAPRAPAALPNVVFVRQRNGLRRRRLGGVSAEIDPELTEPRPLARCMAGRINRRPTSVPLGD